MFDGQKADIWAAGLTLLEIYKNQSPIELLKMSRDLSKRITESSEGFFQEKLDQIEELKTPKEGTIWWVIKGLLDPNEKPYKETQKRAVRRIKKTFLDLVGGIEVSEHRHKERLSSRVESVYFPKAINMGLLKKFNLEANRDGETVYVFEYEGQEKIEKLLEGRLN